MTLSKEAAALRMKDTGWGWCIASVVPIIGMGTDIYYSWTRRTWKPLQYVWGVPFLVGVAIGLTAPTWVESEEGQAGLIALNFTAPLLFKAAQIDARKAAEQRLNIVTES